ncbi:MAG: anti-sigma factor domain-containing protein [Actinomycetota bacterium]|nr:anti-sigma factor domain-containing protein [Actinomycetota bacterium]
MKAVIMEIHKDYCIVMTKDGQFLKQNIPAGVFEIGDEIAVSKEYAHEPKTVKVGWLKNLSIAYMTMIIVAVLSIFGVWYFKQYLPLKNADLLTANTTAEAAPEAADEKAGIGEAREESAEESGLSMEADQGEAISFEKTYSLIEVPKVDGENINGVLSFSYEIIGGVNLQVEFRNISSALVLNGNITLTTLFSDNSVSRIENIPLENFEPAQVVKEPIFLKVEETGLKLEANGNAY